VRGEHSVSATLFSLLLSASNILCLGARTCPLLRTEIVTSHVFIKHFDLFLPSTPRSPKRTFYLFIFQLKYCITFATSPPPPSPTMLFSVIDLSFCSRSICLHNCHSACCCSQPADPGLSDSSLRCMFPYVRLPADSPLFSVFGNNLNLFCYILAVRTFVHIPRCLYLLTSTFPSFFCFPPLLPEATIILNHFL
jgi:hypothetical protein